MQHGFVFCSVLQESLKQIMIINVDILPIARTRHEKSIITCENTNTSRCKIFHKYVRRFKWQVKPYLLHMTLPLLISVITRIQKFGSKRKIVLILKSALHLPKNHSPKLFGKLKIILVFSLTNSSRNYYNLWMIVIYNHVRSYSIGDHHRQ